MIIQIILVWILLTYPIVRAVLKDLEEKNVSERYSTLFQIMLLFQCMKHVPTYYFMMFGLTITKLFKKR
jgi:hypothetical protein